jgi:hypothetical protein
VFLSKSHVRKSKVKWGEQWPNWHNSVALPLPVIVARFLTLRFSWLYGEDEALFIVDKFLVCDESKSCAGAYVLLRCFQVSGVLDNLTLKSIVLIYLTFHFSYWKLHPVLISIRTPQLFHYSRQTIHTIAIMISLLDISNSPVYASPKNLLHRTSQFLSSFSLLL